MTSSERDYRLIDEWKLGLLLNPNSVYLPPPSAALPQSSFIRWIESALRFARAVKKGLGTGRKAAIAVRCSKQGNMALCGPAASDRGKRGVVPAVPANQGAP